MLYLCNETGIVSFILRYVDNRRDPVLNDQNHGKVAQVKISDRLLTEPNLQSFYFNFGRLYTRGRIIRLDELGQTFVVRLVIRL